MSNHHIGDVSKTKRRAKPLGLVLQLSRRVFAAHSKHGRELIYWARDILDTVLGNAHHHLSRFG